jgi:hypothetical protein
MLGEGSWVVFKVVTIAYIFSVQVVVWWRWTKASMARDEE